MKVIVRAIKKIIRLFRSGSHAFNLELDRLKHLKSLGFYPKRILDVGASNGKWTKTCLKFFPEAQYLCVEPLKEHETQLAMLCKENKNIAYWMGCLGPREGTTILNADGDGSSVLLGHSGNPYGTQRDVKVETLDNLISKIGFESPDLLKIDVQGYELEVLKGAKNSLKTIQAIILEISLFSFQSGMPIMHEVIGQMAEYGFVVYDVLRLSVRPLDGALAQIDLLFLKDAHFLRNSNKWDKNSVY